jgi:hypothetical protein
VVASQSLSCDQNEVRFKKFAEFACARTVADLSLEFALPNTNQPIGVSAYRVTRVAGSDPGGRYREDNTPYGISELQHNRQVDSIRQPVTFKRLSRMSR